MVTFMAGCSACDLEELQSSLRQNVLPLHGHLAILGDDTLCVAALDNGSATAPHYSRDYLRRILDRGAADLVDVPDEALLFEMLCAPAAMLVHSPEIAGLACSRDAESAASAVLKADAFLPFRAAQAELRADIAALECVRQDEGCILLGNRGLLVWASNEQALGERIREALQQLRAAYEKEGLSVEFQLPTPERAFVLETAPRMRSLLGTDKSRAAVVSSGFGEFPQGGLLADHVTLGEACFCQPETLVEELEQFARETGGKARLAAVFGKAVFFAGRSLREANDLRTYFSEALLCERLTKAFGGPRYLSESDCRALRRSSGCSSCECCATGPRPRMDRRICLVTGGAQGFGWGIARALAAEGATVAIADLNEEGAAEGATKLNDEFGADTAFSLVVNIADEDSVQAMAERIVETTGGLDMLVANAGVLKAGSVKELDKRDWDLVTNVNYTGYFLCVKHCSQIMGRQWQDQRGPWMDIVQINSKSGLEGSNRNGAYAGSKFGTIGLTQSFAKELVDDRVKVNSICPGNFFDGPLWSDPEKGLFVQYLRTGKVAGAETIEDVKHSYEAKVPMGRGCTPADVANAIFYLVDQQYETGQAVPVTGGQVMLS